MRMFSIAVATAFFLAFTASCTQPETVKVISIGYHSDACSECNELKSKMKWMNVKFIFSPVRFIKYDKTNDASKKASEKELEEAGFLETAKRDDGLKKVILYSAQTKKILETLHWDDSSEILSKKISETIARSR